MRIISGTLKNKAIQSPKGDETRPTSNRLRECLFNICQGLTEEALFLDLFAGSGAMGFEALSRGALRATFVDNARESVKCIEANAKALQVDKQVEVYCGDVFASLKKLEQRKKQFTLIYADPPYELKDLEQGEYLSALVVKLIDNSHLLAPGGRLFIEDAKKANAPQEGLEKLELISSRAMGRSTLLEYGLKS